MLTLVGAPHRHLAWSQDSSWTRRFTLTADELPAGTLEFPGHFGTLATARTGDGCWTFKRVGFWQQRASIRACGADHDFAVFQNDTWSRGRIARDDRRPPISCDHECLALGAPI